MKSSNFKLGDPRCPYTQYFVDTSDNLAELFGPDDKIFPLIFDVNEDKVDAIFGSANAWNRGYDSDDSCSEFPWNRFRRGRNHECMWGGQCCNKEFQRARPRNPVPVAKPQQIGVNPKFSAGPQPIGVNTKFSAGRQPMGVSAKLSVKQHSIAVNTKFNARQQANGVNAKVSAGPCAVRPVDGRTKNVPQQNSNRSLLLNRVTAPLPPQPPPTPQSSRPETPVSMASEDDLGPIAFDPLNTSGVFRSALDHLTTVPSLNSFVLGDSNRTKQEKPVIRTNADTISDHNYGVTSKSFKLQGLGVETPSDSEEEIDVVSVTSGERSRSGSFTLPTRPTATDRRQLESLLSASQAVSRKLKRGAPLTCPVTPKRGRAHHTDDESMDDTNSYESSEDDSDEDLEEGFSEDAQSVATYYRPGRPRGSPGRRKKGGFCDEDKRDLHNNMERQRRVDLRNSFEMLRELVPSVACQERAAKVAILREAASHCRELNAEGRGRSAQVQALKREQERLRKTVSALRRAAAVCRR